MVDTPTEEKIGSAEDWRYHVTPRSAEVRIGNNLTLRPHWYGPMDAEEIRAVVRMASAAPTLYEELKASAMAVHTIGHYHSPTCVSFENCTKERCVKARAALALVDGPQNQETR